MTFFALFVKNYAICVQYKFDLNQRSSPGAMSLPTTMHRERWRQFCEFGRQSYSCGRYDNFSILRKNL